MAKKSKKRLQQLIAKKQQLQHLSGAQTTVKAKASHQPQKELVTAAETPTASSVYVGRELIRTLVSVAIVLILLGVGAWLDRETDYLTNIGSWLYTTLRLDS